MTPIEIGRLLRSGTSGFIAGCRVNQLDSPAFGSLVRVPLEIGYQVFGLIHDIHVDDDGLVRQLVTADRVSEEVLRDNRERRIVPIEMSVLSVGYERDGHIFHRLPPRPPLSLDLIYQCDEQDLSRFTSTRQFGYFRHILGALDIPVGELLAAHIRQVEAVLPDGKKWREAAVREIKAPAGRDMQRLPPTVAVFQILNDDIRDWQH